MEEYSLDAASIAALKERFYDFGDAVIQNIWFSMEGGRYCYTINLNLHIWDVNPDPNIPRVYVNVTFIMSGILSFKIDYESQYNLQVISDEIEMIPSEESILLDFYADGQYTPEGYTESRLHFVCRQCVVKIEPVD